MVRMVEFSEIVLRVTPVQEPLITLRDSLLITYICHVVCSWIVFCVFKASLMYLNHPVSSRATKTTIDIKGCMFSHIFPYGSIRKYVFLWMYSRRLNKTRLEFCFNFYFVISVIINIIIIIFLLFKIMLNKSNLV